MQHQLKQVVEKLKSLSSERLTQVEDFIDFLQQRDRDIGMGRDFARVSEESFRKIWDNDDDAAYDQT